MNSVKKWCQGLLHSTEVQSTCFDAYRDQKSLLESLDVCSTNCNGGLKSFAKLGAWGEAKCNINRDVLACLGTPDTCPMPIIMQAPCNILKPGKDRSIQSVAVPFMAPHLVLHHMYSHNRSRFNELLFGCQDPGVLKQFWKSAIKAKDPRLANHPMVRVPGWENKAIPISLHGDAVPAVGVGKAHSKSFDCYSWMSLLAKGSTSHVKQYLVGIFDDCKVKPSEVVEHDTMAEIWRHITWSLFAAYRGFFPDSTAHNKLWEKDSLESQFLGKQLAGWYLLVLWSLKGDL